MGQRQEVIGHSKTGNPELNHDLGFWRWPHPLNDTLTCHLFTCHSLNRCSGAENPQQACEHMAALFSDWLNGTGVAGGGLVSVGD